MIISYIGYKDSGEIIACITNNIEMMDVDAAANSWPNVMEGYATPWGHYVNDGDICPRPEMPISVSERTIAFIPIGAVIYIDGDIYNTTDISIDLNKISKLKKTVKIEKFPFVDFIISL